MIQLLFKTFTFNTSNSQKKKKNWCLTHSLHKLKKQTYKQVSSHSPYLCGQASKKSVTSLYSTPASEPTFHCMSLGVLYTLSTF